MYFVTFPAQIHKKKIQLLKKNQTSGPLLLGYTIYLSVHMTGFEYKILINIQAIH